MCFELPTCTKIEINIKTQLTRLCVLDGNALHFCQDPRLEDAYLFPTDKSEMFLGQAKIE